MNQKIFKGQMYYADLDPVVGSEQGGIRPIIVIQNDIGNKHSPTIIVCSITSQVNKQNLPTHVNLKDNFGLQKNSVAMLEQIRTIDKKRLKEYIGKCDKEVMDLVNKAIISSFFLTD
jgi:mRNA interferase MazF